MRIIHLAFFLLVSGFTAKALASDSTTAVIEQFTKVDLATYIDNNQISSFLAEKYHRSIVKPTAIQFDAKLMRQPKPGKFTLVQDSLSVWGEAEDSPNVTHSAFLQASDERVINTYVSAAAAEQLEQLYSDNGNHPVPSHIYAIHIYNYANGPRLVVIGAEAIQHK